MDDADRQKRAEQRRKTMTIRWVRTADTDIDFDPVFGAEGVYLTASISRQLWALNGRPFPSYERKDIPVRFRRWNEE